MLCDTRLTGRRGECRNPMQEIMDSLGRVTLICHRCEWKKQGFCWECGEKKEGKQLYCRPCAKKKQRIATQRHNKSADYKQKSSVYFKNRWHTDAEFRKKKTQQKREWLEKNPHKKEEYKIALIYKELQRDARKT